MNSTETFEKHHILFKVEKKKDRKMLDDKLLY